MASGHHDSWTGCPWNGCCGVITKDDGARIHLLIAGRGQTFHYHNRNGSWIRSSLGCASKSSYRRGPMRKPRKPLTPQRRMNEAIWLRFARCLSRCLFPLPCDGSCLSLPHKEDQVVLCEDGEHLRFYFCVHTNTHVLTNYIPAPQ